MPANSQPQVNYASRHFALKKIDPDLGLFIGYATVFGHIDCEHDVFVPGAFSKFLQTVNKKKVKLLWQHDPNYPIGIFNVIKEDNYGLLVSGRLLLDLPKAREAYTLMKSGVVDALSIGFTVAKDKHDHQHNVRLIQEAKLWEISLVTFPANSKAKVYDVKSNTNDWSALVAEMKNAILNLY